MIAEVLRLIEVAALPGSRLYRLPSTSTKAGLAPHRRTVDAVAKNVSGGTMTSVPFPIVWARRAMCKAAVPLATAIPCLRPTSRANAASKAFTFGPWASIPDARTCLTAASSSSPRIGRAIGIIAARTDTELMQVRRSLARTRRGLPLGTEFGKRPAIVTATHLSVEGTTALTHPTDDSRRHPCDQGVLRDIPRNDRSGSHHGVATD